VVSHPDARLLKARIAIQISPSRRLTAMVRTRVHQRRKLPIRLQPSGRLLLTVRTLALQIWKLRVEELPSGRSSPMVRMLESLRRKLLAADVRPSGRCAIPVRTKLLNRIDFLQKLSKNHVAQFSVRTAPRYILPDAHLSPQPINRGPWALRTARIRCEFH
jgi:hypothetical protein